MLGARQRQVAHHVQAVAAARCPSGYDGDHDFGHEPDEPLALQDVQAAEPRGVDTLGRVAGGVLVAGAATDALVAAGAERPAAISRRRPVAGEQHGADVGRHPGVVQGAVQLVDGARAEGVAYLRSVECDPHGALVDRPVVGDVGEILEPVDDPPPR
jgi:hypothetical protein